MIFNLLLCNKVTFLVISSTKSHMNVILMKIEFFIKTTKTKQTNI